MVGRRTLNPVVKVRVLVPQLTEYAPPSMALLACFTGSDEPVGGFEATELGANGEPVLGGRLH